MKRSTLASRLIEAQSSGERKKLLAMNAGIADAQLARELKDHCYRVWASEPTGAQKAASALNTLIKFSTGDETGAMRYWVEGIADITRGRLEPAIENLQAASKSLLALGREHESAQPQVAMLIALAMLGRYDDARRTGERALKIFEKYNDLLAAGKIEMNLSNIVSRRDQYRLAERYCISAYRRFRRLGEKEWQTMAENGLANTYAQLNDFTRAEKFYQLALERARAGRMRVTVAEIEASMGNLELFRGRYAEAIRWLELSRQKYEKLGMPHQTAVAELEIADIYAELNLNSEAIEIYRKLIPTLKRLKLRGEEARARANLGRAFIASGDRRLAAAELKRAAQLFRIEKNYVAAAAVELRQASIELSKNNFTAALEIVTHAGATLDTSENLRLRLSAMWLRGEALGKLGRLDEAQAILDRTLRASREFDQPAIAQATLNSLGVFSQIAGKARTAEGLFEAAIRLAETTRAPLPGEEFRMALMSKMLAPYENLARLYLAEEKPDKAFVCVEMARSRSLLEAVRGHNPTQRNTAAAKLREELNWFYSRMARAEDAEVAKLQKEVRTREKSLASLNLRAQSTAATRTQKGTPAIDIGKLTKQLGSGRAMIEFVEQDGVYSAFVVTQKNGVVYVAAVSSEGEVLSVLDGLHFQFGALRFGTDLLNSFGTQLKAHADSYLRTLYEKLLAPLARHVGDLDLVIVPAGALNYVPFHALFDGDRYVVESREVVYSPSAAVWQKLNSRRPRTPTNALLMAYADERIPLADSEVARLATKFPTSIKFSGRRATFVAFETNASKADLIHLACHGQFRPDNPMFSSLHLADGWVTVRDVCSRRLNAELVTLSACETGLSQVFAGDEILGLARGFLSAGAKSLVLSLWTVNDTATAGLMEDFYDNLQRGKSIAASLRVAQVNLIKRGEHPYFWSPFFVIG